MNSSARKKFRCIKPTRDEMKFPLLFVAQRSCSAAPSRHPIGSSASTLVAARPSRRQAAFLGTSAAGLAESPADLDAGELLAFATAGDAGLLQSFREDRDMRGFDRGQAPYRTAGGDELVDRFGTGSHARILRGELAEAVTRAILSGLEAGAGGGLQRCMIHRTKRRCRADRYGGRPRRGRLSRGARDSSGCDGGDELTTLHGVLLLHRVRDHGRCRGLGRRRSPVIARKYANDARRGPDCLGRARSRQAGGATSSAHDFLRHAATKTRDLRTLFIYLWSKLLGHDRRRHARARS